MWAPDCVEKDGKYYFYFPAAPKGEEKGKAESCLRCVETDARKFDGYWAKRETG